MPTMSDLVLLRFLELENRLRKLEDTMQDLENTVSSDILTEQDIKEIIRSQIHQIHQMKTIENDS